VPQRRDCLLHERQASDTDQVFKPLVPKEPGKPLFSLSKGGLCGSSAIDHLAEGILLHSRTKLYRASSKLPLLDNNPFFAAGVLGRNVGENSQDPYLGWDRTVVKTHFLMV